MMRSMPRSTFLRKSVAKLAPRKFRPQLEALEDRFQPSFTGLALNSMEAHPIMGFQHTDLAAQNSVANGVHRMLMLTTATYITGTTGSATAQGIALAQDGSTYETGTITLGVSEEAYVAKYDPNGKQVYLVPFHLMDGANTPLNTEGHALAVDGIGNVYVAGAVFNTSSLANAYAMKLSADGSTVLWEGGIIGPSTGDGIAVNDPNNDGNGQAVLIGTFTNSDPTQGPVGDHLLAARFAADGMSFDYDYFYTFGPSDGGTHGKAIALNTTSTTSTPGSLAYIAGNIIFNGNQDISAVQIDDGTSANAGNINWSTGVGNSVVTPNTDTLTGVAVNPDDTSVFSGTVATSSGTAGIVAGYPVKGVPPGQLPPLLAVLPNALSLNAITVDSAGNIYTTGAAANPSSGGVYLAALDHLGNFVSDLQFGDTGTVDAGYGIVATSSNSLWLVGVTTSSSFSTDGTTLNGTQDGWLASIATP